MASPVLIALSSVLLLHSGYSAHEHTLTSPHPLPTDIAIETVVSVALLCLGIVLSGSHALRPISWRTWNGLAEREKGAGPFAWLDECPGFLNIRSKRTQFGELMKTGAAGS